MKVVVSFLVFLLITFLSTPTIISVLDKDADISYFYTLSEEEEEENQVSFDEIKSVALSSQELLSFFYNSSATLNVAILANLSFTNLAHQIFSPPPELI
jgi:hypothetical protein